MSALKKNWWKISLAVILGVILDMLLHTISPAGGPELQPGVFSQITGLIPGITLLLTILFAVIAVTFVLMQEGMPGRKWIKGLHYGLAIGSLWFVGMFEGSVAAKEPWSSTIFWALEDSIPIILMCVLLALLTATDTIATTKIANGLAFPIVGLNLMVGRYIEYSVLQPQVGYWSNPLATFGWTLILGLTIGMMYWLLASSLKGASPLKRTLWFSVVVFGFNWWLFNIFVPILFQPPSAFTMAAVTTRVLVDIVFVSLGVFALERVDALKSNSKAEPRRMVIS